MAEQIGTAREAALAASSRRRLLEVLRSSSSPLDAEQLAAAVDLHVTTARHHLGTLERAGLVRRDVERAGRPGRPRLLYSPAPDATAADGYRVLTDVLSEEWEQDPDSGRRRAEQAGRRWAAVHLAPATGISLDEALDEVDALFDRLGFAPRRADIEPGHRFLLDGCPFRDVARRHTEVVCTVHLGLLRGALDLLGVERTEAHLHPFVEPELCVADVRSAGAAVPGSGVDEARAVKRACVL